MFKWLKRIVLIVLFLCAIILGIIFTSENNMPVSVLFLGYELPALQLGLWLLVSLLLGSFIGLLLTLLPNLSHQQQLASKERKINNLQKELNALRNSAVKG